LINISSGSWVNYLKQKQKIKIKNNIDRG